MAQLVVTNVSGEDVTISDLYKSLAPGESVTTSRSGSDFPRMKSLQNAIAAGRVTVSITPDAQEALSGLLSPPASVTAEDIAPVPATAVTGGLVVLRQQFAGDRGGSPDVVTIVGLGGLSTPLRVVDAFAYVSTRVIASVLEVRTQPSGAGGLLATFDSGTAGKKTDAPTP